MESAFVDDIAGIFDPFLRFSPGESAPQTGGRQEVTILGIEDEHKPHQDGEQPLVKMAWLRQWFRFLARDQRRNGRRFDLYPGRWPPQSRRCCGPGNGRSRIYLHSLTP